jgi:hypothetical protein
MKVMVIVKATKSSEAGDMPSEQLLTAMGHYNEELVKAGILLAAEGLHPSSKGFRIRFSGSNRSGFQNQSCQTEDRCHNIASWQLIHLYLLNFGTSPRAKSKTIFWRLRPVWRRSRPPCRN